MARRWIIFFTILGLTLFYTGTKAAALFPAHPEAAWILTPLFFLFMIGWQFLYRAQSGRLKSIWFRGLIWAGSFILGIWTTFIFFSIPLDLIRWVLVGTQHLWGVSIPALVQVIWKPFAVILVSAVFAGLGLSEALSGPDVVEVDIRYPQLASALQGLRIALISDLHVGPTIRDGYVAQVVQKIQALNPDLIAVTGDLADGPVPLISPLLGALAALRAPLGVYYVTGNHEYYWGAEEWVAQAKVLGFVPLLNENRIVTRGNARLLVGGITDAMAEDFDPAHRPDVQQAAATTEKVDFKMLLSHRPGAYKEAEPAGFNLQLSGHTHGGQFFPWSLIIGWFHRYYRGLNRHRKLQLYVSPGTGYWGPPDRFLVPAEITLLRLMTA